MKLSSAQKNLRNITIIFFKQLNHVRQSNQSFSRFDNSFIIEATPLERYLKAAHDELDIVFKTLYTVTLRAAAKTHTRSARFTVVFFSPVGSRRENKWILCCGQWDTLIT